MRKKRSHSKAIEITKIEKILNLLNSRRDKKWDQSA
jgi:hypothetical protein